MIRSEELKVGAVLHGVFSALIAAIFIMYCVVLIAPPNTLSWSARTRSSALALVPEGWAFFTRSPREESLSAFRWEGQAWRALTFQNAEKRAAFGFARTARLVSVEMAHVLGGVPTEAWERGTASGRIVDYERLRGSVVHVTNRMHSPQLCGEVLFERRAPDPFAWTSLRTRPNAPVSRLLLEVECLRP